MPGRKEMRMMKNGRKIAALLACVLLLGVLLSACGGNKCSLCGKSIRGAGHSTSAGLLCDDCYNSFSGLGTTATRSTNTGVWIAITVMVFVAVFAATSGVVYLVLQKRLPPDTTAPRAARRRAPQEEEYDDVSRPALPVQRPGAHTQRPAAPNRPTASANRPAARRGYTGEWVCPRDRSRNSGPYCTLCGAPRPQAPRSASAVRPAANGSSTQRPARPAAQPPQPAPQPVQRQTYAESFQPAPKSAPATAWQEPDILDTYLREPDEYAPQTAAPAAEPTPAYSGKFARKPQNQDPPAPPQDDQQPEAPAAEPEYDAELLAAIFRQAEQGTDEN